MTHFLKHLLFVYLPLNCFFLHQLLVCNNVVLELSLCLFTLFYQLLYFVSALIHQEKSLFLLFFLQVFQLIRIQLQIETFLFIELISLTIKDSYFIQFFFVKFETLCRFTFHNSVDFIFQSQLLVIKLIYPLLKRCHLLS